MNRQLSIWQEQKNPMVRMHNYLVTAKLGYLELSSLRIFLLMIAKLKWDDKDLLPVRITLTDVIPSYTGGSSLELIIKACRELKSKMQDVEMLSIENGKTVYERMTVIDKVRYVQGTDYIEAHFGRAIKPYLIDLKEHFTTAELRELMKLKSTHAIRFYLLVKSIYRSGETYSISVKDFKQMLVGDTDKYSEYKDFKKVILKPTQTTLSKTTAAFDFEEERKGRSVEILHIKPVNNISLNQWQCNLAESTLKLLKENKVNLTRINEMLASDEITEEYILYVIDAKLKDKKVKKPGGAIYDAIVNKHLWDDFQKMISKSKKLTSTSLTVLDQTNPSYQIISMAQAEQIYEKEKKAGTTKWPLPGFIKGLKTGRNIIVEGFTY